MAQQSNTFPQAWLEAEGEFGALAIEYRLTNECDIDPGFAIVEHPDIDVTRQEILGSIAAFLKQASREDIPDEAYISASLDVFDQKTIPDRTLETSEYDALLAALERLGPWPETRSMPLGGNTYKCTFDEDGLLIKVEKLAGEKEGYTEFDGQLAEQGPFRLRWQVEE